MKPGNASVWTNPQTLPENSGSSQGTKHLQAKARQAEAETVSDYLIDNFNASSHVRANPALVGELASI